MGRSFRLQVALRNSLRVNLTESVRLLRPPLIRKSLFAYECPGPGPCLPPPSRGHLRDATVG
jgi:hypothetical protein